jgi:membrane protease subunit HflK
MREVLSSTNKIMMDYRGSGNLLYLPLDKIMQQSGGAPAPEGQGAARAPEAPAADGGPRSRETLRNRDRADR